MSYEDVDDVSDMDVCGLAMPDDEVDVASADEGLLLVPGAGPRVAIAVVGAGDARSSMGTVFCVYTYACMCLCQFVCVCIYV